MSAVVDASLLVGALTGADQQGRWCEKALERAELAAPELALAADYIMQSDMKPWIDLPYR